MRRPCDRCGKPYDAKRPQSRFCSPACRVAAGRARGAGVSESVAPVVVPSGTTVVGAVEVASRVALEAAGMLETPRGATVMALARRIDADADTGSALAAMVKEHGTKLDELLALAPVADDPVDELRLRRERRRSAGA